MKKTIVTVITSIALLSANAQIEKGTNALGLNLVAIYNNNFTTYQTNNTLGLKVQLVFDHFIAKNLSLGVALNYGIIQSNFVYTSGTYTDNNEINIQNYGAQIQLKKYWFATNKVAFTLTPVLSSYYNETSFASYNNNGSKGSNNYNNWTHSANCNIGASYFIKQNLTIEAQTTFLNYSFTPERNNFGNTNNFDLFIVPSNLLLGVKFIFGKPQLK